MKSTKRLLSLVLTILLLGSTLAMPAFAAEELVYGIGFVNTNGLRLRSEATTSSKALDTAADNECVVVLSQVGDWYKVSYNLQEGYMYKSYLDVLTRENAELGYGKVTGSAVNLRKGPGTGYGVAGMAKKGDKLYIIGLNDGWYKVLVNNNSCYIRSDFLELTEIPYENGDSSNSPKYFRGGKSIGSLPTSSTQNSGSTGKTFEGNVTGQDIVAEAEKYLGIPYVYGGASPSGFDCSGFTYYVLKNLGYSPNRTPQDQYVHGSFVTKAELQPGDLVFFSSNGGATITHVGIYVGNGQFIHSPNSRSTVSYSDLTSGYWSNTYYGGRRVV